MQSQSIGRGILSKYRTFYHDFTARPIHYFCNLSNIDGRVYVYVCIWLGLGLVLGFGLGLEFAMICSGHGHLCLTGCRNSAP